MTEPTRDHDTKFEVNIEGAVHEWDQDTISVPQIRELGSLPTDLPVVEVDLESNEEITLADDAVVHLKPGKAFGRKVSFKRG